MTALDLRDLQCNPLDMADMSCTGLLGYGGMSVMPDLMAPLRESDFDIYDQPALSSQDDGSQSSCDGSSPASTSSCATYCPEFPATTVEAPLIKSEPCADADAAAPSPKPQPTTTLGRPRKPAPKRKRPNRYKDASPEVIMRRREQNRLSQKAYRERKDQRIIELEHALEDANKQMRTMREAYEQLHARYANLQNFGYVC